MYVSVDHADNVEINTSEIEEFGDLLTDSFENSSEGKA